MLQLFLDMLGYDEICVNVPNSPWMAFVLILRSIPLSTWTTKKCENKTLTQFLFQYSLRVKLHYLIKYQVTVESEKLFESA